MDREPKSARGGSPGPSAAGRADPRAPTPAAPRVATPVVTPAASPPPVPASAVRAPAVTAEETIPIPITEDDRRVGGEFTVHGVVSPLVGRERELAVLRQVVERATTFQHPEVVTIVGNQGTGKTRLVAEWLVDVDAPVRVYRGRASDPAVRYGAVSRLLRDRFGIPENEDPEVYRDRFREAVQVIFGDRRVSEVVHFLGPFVGLRFAESLFVRAFEDNPRQHDEIARAVLRRLLEVDASVSPLVLVLDDLHLADDDTLALLEEIADGLAGSMVVLVVMARPELLARRPRWGAGNAEHTRIDLRNLDPPRAASMFRALLAHCDSVPRDLVEDAVEMTGGNPFFLEQLVRVMVGNGTIDTGGHRWRLDPERAAATELPLTVEQAIAARIAVLEPEERALLEKGATFGNVFWVDGVVALARNEVATPAPAAWTDDGRAARFLDIIDNLADRDYLLRLPAGDSTVPGDVEVMFKHNLERDLIASLTNVERRRRYPLVAAQWLESKLTQTDRSEEQLEFLAQLYERGGDARRAARLYLAAGDRSRARYANEQSAAYYQKGLAILGDEDVLARIDALHNLGDVLGLVGRHEDAAARFHEMLGIAWRFDFLAKGGAAHGRIGRLLRGRGDFDQALEHFHTAHRLFERAGDRRGVAAMLDDVGKIHWLRGAYPTALGCHRQALALRREIGDGRSIALSLANLGLVLRDMGSFEAAVEHLREAMELRRKIGDRPGVVSSMCDLGSVHGAHGKLEAANEILGEALKSAREIGDRLLLANVLGRLAEVELEMGRLRAAADRLQEAQEIVHALGDRLGQAECARRVAEVCMALGRRTEAGGEAMRALELAEKLGSRPHVASAERLLGEVSGAFAASPEEQELAHRHFRRAIEILTELENELELARCYRAFAAFQERCGLHPAAAEMRSRADEIFARLRGAASAPAR